MKAYLPSGGSDVTTVKIDYGPLAPIYPTTTGGAPRSTSTPFTAH